MYKTDTKMKHRVITFDIAKLEVQLEYLKNKHFDLVPKIILQFWGIIHILQLGSLNLVT